MNKVEQAFRRLFITTLLVIVVILVVIGGFVYYIDPYQQFKKSDIYINDARLEIPGISRFHDYNTVLMGSSMAMNHEPKQVDTLFSKETEKWVTRNFTLVGGMSDDYFLILNRLFKDNKVQHIIFDFDFFSFAKQQNAIADYLYSDNIFDKFKYIYNFTTLKNCIKKLYSPVPEDSLYHFYSKSGHQELFNNYNKSKDELFEHSGYRFEFDLMKERFEEHLRIYIQERPDIEWFIYFPPYSIFEFIKYRDGGHWEAILQFKRFVIETLLQQPNVKLYDFQPEESWIMNLDEYMDVRHHSHKFNHAIISSIYNNEYLVTEENYLGKIDSLNMSVLGVDVDTLMAAYKGQ